MAFMHEDEDPGRPSEAVRCVQALTKAQRATLVKRLADHADTYALLVTGSTFEQLLAERADVIKAATNAGRLFDRVEALVATMEHVTQLPPGELERMAFARMRRAGPAATGHAGGHSKELRKAAEQFGDDPELRRGYLELAHRAEQEPTPAPAAEPPRGSAGPRRSIIELAAQLDALHRS